MQYYETPRLATLADGAKVPSILGEFVANIELRTIAGVVELPNTTIDILQGPEKGNLPKK